MANPLADLELVRKSGDAASPSDLQGKVVLLYFSAHWCPPCRGFTPMLRKFYEAVKSKGENIEIVFVSGDRDEAAFKEYFQNEHGDWLAVKYGSSQIDMLNKVCNVSGIPCLFLVNHKGQGIDSEAREGVQKASTESAMLATFAEWKKASGDWRETAGTTLGGASQAPANDAAAMRAARLARLGGGPPVPAAAAPPAAAVPAVVPAAAAPPAAVPAASLAPPVSADTVVTPAKIEQLTGMGFTEEQSRNALEAVNGDVQQATELLIESA